jgi:hypothetical protein
MKTFRSIPLAMAMLAVSQLHAATITHKVSSEISTVEVDNLEAQLVSGDTLWIKANDGLTSASASLNFDTPNLTLILDADADRDGTGTLTSGFTLNATGSNTQVRILMGKNSRVGSLVTVPFHKDNFPLIATDNNPGSYSYPYKFYITSDSRVDVLYLLNSRTDMDELHTVLAAGNGPAPATSKSRYGYALGQDLDMGSTAFSPMNTFRGIFDGFKHKLSNLSISGGSLFSETKFANIRNLDIANVSITNSGSAVAGIIDSASVLTNIRVQSGSISGSYGAGIAYALRNSSTISYCVNKADISTTGGASGILHANQGGVMGHVENWGTITSSGGLAAGIVNESFQNGFSQYLVNYGAVSGASAAGILGRSPIDSLFYVYNYGAISAIGVAGGIADSIDTDVRYAVNTATVTSTTSNAAGIVPSGFSAIPRNGSYLVNTGSIEAFKYASSFATSTSSVGNMLNTGSIHSQTSNAAGLSSSCTFGSSYSLISAAITGASTQVACVNSKFPYFAIDVAYNISLAPTATNAGNAATALTFSSIYNLANYPSSATFVASWFAPATPIAFTLPTPKDLFPDGQVYKKLRQDAVAKDDTAALVLDSIHTYLPTYGNDWTYSCKARNGLATCAVSAQATTITQAYNVTGAETIVFEAAHASGLVVRDSLQVQYNVERKSAPKLSAAWPADTVVTEGAPVVLDLGQYFTDADGESITYTLSKTSVVYSELNGDVLTLCYDKKVGKETFTVYATDAGGRKSPVASLAVTVSTLPGVLKALPVLVLKTDSVLTLDLDDYFWDADDDVLGYTVTEPKNNDVVLKGSILQIAMTSLRPDSLVITVADDDKHVLLAGLKLVNSASTVLAVHPEQRLGLELAGNLLRLTSTESATAWLRILDLQGGLRYETTLDLATGTNALALPALPPGAYRIHVRQGDNLRTLGWEKR